MGPPLTSTQGDPFTLNVEGTPCLPVYCLVWTEKLGIKLSAAVYTKIRTTDGQSNARPFCTLAD